MNDMLNGALVSGTGKRAAIPLHAAAGKTGTTQSFRDAWFIGYTAHLTTGVWTGNDDGSAMNRVVGGSLPAEIWREIMTRAHTGLQPLPLSGAEPATATWEPAYPQDRIGDDFIAGALGNGAGATGSIEQLIRNEPSAGAGGSSSRVILGFRPSILARRLFLRRRRCCAVSADHAPRRALGTGSSGRARG